MIKLRDGRRKIESLVVRFVIKTYETDEDKERKMANSKTSLSITPEAMETSEGTNNGFGMGTGAEKDEDNLTMPFEDTACCCCCGTGGSDIMKEEEIIL